MFTNSETHERTVKVIGASAMEKLCRSRIAVFGAGGVGGAVIEALARIGVGAIDVTDGDGIAQSNLNRQLLATVDTVGKRKADAARDRIAAINPDCKVAARDMFVTPDNIGGFGFAEYSYVIDAIDNVTAKIAIIQACREVGVPVISSMGTGNKIDPTRFRITDIEKTSVCPLARVMRRELKNRGVTGVDALWSDEIPVRDSDNSGDSRTPGSVSFVPPAAGMIIAGFVVKKLIEK